MMNLPQSLASISTRSLMLILTVIHRRNQSDIPHEWDSRSVHIVRTLIEQGYVEMLSLGREPLGGGIADLLVREPWRFALTEAGQALRERCRAQVLQQRRTTEISRWW